MLYNWSCPDTGSSYRDITIIHSLIAEMSDRSGLAAVEDLNTVLNTTLDEFVERHPEVLIIDDSTTLEEFVKQYVQDHPSDKSVCIFDLTSVLVQYKTWFNVFGDVQPFYAMKCNPNPKLMDLMCSLPGMCVDCAGVEEINMCLSRGIKPDHIIFANPIKSVEGIECMRKNGIWTGTVDSIEEVQKMHDVLGEDAKHCRIVIRLWVDDSHSIIALGSKFGCHLSEVRGILNQVQLCGMEAVGVAFHVGTGNEDQYAYEKAVRDSAEVFKMAKEFGFTMTLLDLGGGWAGDLGNDKFENPSLTSVCGIIRDAVKKHEVFSTEGFRMISEPGRYFNNNTVSVACKVLNVSKRGGRTVYKINEGVMGVFHDLILCDMNFDVEPLVEGEKHPASIIGSSIMQKDVVLSNIDLPEMKVGDIILFKNIGAYSVSLTTLPLRRNQDHVYIVRRSSLCQHK